MAIDEQQKKFIDNYLQTYSIEQSAVNAGYPKKDAMSIGIDLLANEEIQELINNNYHKTEAISIDYAVMEKSDSIYVVPSRFGWDDVGSWEALERYREKDDKGNVLVGSAKVVDSHESLVISSSHDIVVEGLKDIYVIENDGKILVGHKSNVANVKELKKII